MGRRRIAALLAAVLIGAVITAPVAGAAASTVVPGHVLVYGPSLARGPGFDEATVARSLGYQVAVADSIAWNALTSADFAKYDAVIIGDRGCAQNGPGYLQQATATRNRWTPAVTGNVTVLGTDPVFHARRDGMAGARRLVRNGLQLATAGAGTGAYISLGCAYFTADPFTPLPLLSGFGPFTVRGQVAPPFDGCPDQVQVTRPANPLVAGLSDAALSNWTCSIHAGVDSFPFPFLVVARDAPTAMPYLLVRPASSVPGSERRTVYSDPSVPASGARVTAPNHP